MKNKVVISAWSACTPIGCGDSQQYKNRALSHKNEFSSSHVLTGDIFSAIQQSRPATALIQNFDVSHFPCKFGAEARENNQVIASLPHQDRKSMLAQKALDQLILPRQFDVHQAYLICGTGIDHFNLWGYGQHKHDRESHNWSPHTRSSISAVEEMNRTLGFSNAPSVNAAACVASSQAMGTAFRMLEKKPESLVVSGGFDSMLSHLHYMGFYKLGAFSTWEGDAAEACRPFDKERCGIVLGEGAAFFMMQSADRVEDDDSIWAQISGYGSTTDSYLVTDPEPSGKWLALAAQQAIAQAGISPAEIDCVHLHGTGTTKNDLAETKAMEIIFGENQFQQVPVYSMKGQIGHLIGACGAAEMLGVLYSLKYQQVPVTVNSVTADPQVPLNVQRQRPLDLPIKHILKLNAAFGGQNTALVVSKYEK